MFMSSRGCVTNDIQDHGGSLGLEEGGVVRGAGDGGALVPLGHPRDEHRAGDAAAQAVHLLAGGDHGDTGPPPGERGGGLPALADAVELEVGAHSDRLSSVRYFNAIITVDHRLCWPGCKRKLCKLEQTVKL